MAVLPITSYSEHCRPYVPEQYKASSKLLGLVDAFLTQCDSLEAAFHEMVPMLDPEQAVGPSLDFIGALVGVARNPGETDASYRPRILEGSISTGLPSPEPLRSCLQQAFGVAVGIYPVWPAGMYFVLYGSTEVNLAGLVDDYMTSGADLGQGSFLCLEEGEDYGLLMLEDNGQPLVVDQRWPDTEYAMVDDEGYLIVDDLNNVVVGIDYLTTNESFETN